MLRLSNAKSKQFQGQPYTRLDSSKRVKDYFKVSVIQGLIARRGLKAKGFFRYLRISLVKKEKEKNAITQSASSGYQHSKILQLFIHKSKRNKLDWLSLIFHTRNYLSYRPRPICRSQTLGLLIKNFKLLLKGQGQSSDLLSWRAVNSTLGQT